MISLAPRMCLTSTIILGCLAGIACGGEQEQQVQSKDKLVKKNDNIDFKDEETIRAEAVTSFGGRISVLSKTFRPPNAMVFLLFPKSTTHVDIANAPNALPPERLQDTDQRIKIREMFTKPANAGMFRLRAEGNISPTGPGVTPPELHWSVKVPECTIDLVIHNGQGGPPISEADEETIGAFTVANLNDTDGDGKVDKDDDAVIASAKGRNEVDLMELNINPPVPAFGGTVKLKVVSGDVKFWEKPTKEIPVEKLEFEVAKLPHTIWVEARKPSEKLQDIELRIEHPGCQDTVKATAIWAEKTDFLNSGTALSADADGPEIKASFALIGSVFGATQVTPNTLNSMEMEFTLKPQGIGSVKDIIFDVTRQKESKAWEINGTIVAEIINPGLFPSTFPNMDEEPNDDSTANDEDNVPKNDHIYSIDGPGQLGDNASSDREVQRYNFKEFVRVLVNGGAFANHNGPPPEGSRCSPKVEWRSRLDVIKIAATGKWKRNPSGDNEIKEHLKPIGGAPKP